MLASLVSMAAGALLLAGCDTWHGLGKDIGKTGDAMSGEGKYVMTVRATPDEPKVRVEPFRKVRDMLEGK